MSPAPALTRARRPVSTLTVLATVLGLWIGLRAPDASPVAPTGDGRQTPVVDGAATSDTDGPGREGRS